MPLSSGASDAATVPSCSMRGAACSTTDTWGSVAPSAHLTETSESGPGPGAGTAVLTIHDRATVTLTLRSDDEATCARGGTVAIITRTITPSHRSEALV